MVNDVMQELADNYEDWKQRRLELKREEMRAVQARQLLQLTLHRSTFPRPLGSEAPPLQPAVKRKRS